MGDALPATLPQNSVHVGCLTCIICILDPVDFLMCAYL